MCTTNVSKMPDSSNGEAVKLGALLANDDDNKFFKDRHMEVLSPSLYVEEEKRLAGLESNDNEDSTNKKKKKKKKKSRRNVPLEGVLDGKHSKNQRKQNGDMNDEKSNNIDNTDTKQSKKRKRQSDSVNEQDVANSSPKQSKKQKRNNDKGSGMDESHSVSIGSKNSKKQKEQNNNVVEQNVMDIGGKHSKKHKKQNGRMKGHGTNHFDDDDIKPLKVEVDQDTVVTGDRKGTDTMEGKHSKKQKKQNGNANGLETDHVDDSEVKPPKTEISHGPTGSVYRQGMSLTQAIQAKHDAKKKSKTNKWRKNRPIEKGVTRRKSRIEEKLKQLKAKCEALQALKNSGQSVMRQEKRLMSKERKLSSELGVISGSKKERKRKLLERRMTLAEGLSSPHAPSILNSNGAPVKSKFDFSIFSVGNDKSRSSNLRGRDYKRLLQVVEKRNEEVEELKDKDLDKGRKLEEKLAWQAIMSRARGEKVKDDPQMLKRAAKRADKQKEKRKKKWAERVAKVEESMESRQRKRQANLDKRKSDKQDKKRKKAIKKGRYIPGFG